MKLIFNGKTFSDILDQMEDTLSQHSRARKIAHEAQQEQRAEEAQGPGPDTGPDPIGSPVEIYRENPVEKSKRPRSEKQKANDERLRKEAQEKIASGKLFEKKASKPAPVEKAPPPPPPKTAEGMDPAEVVKLRQKTIEDLQSAYADGHQKEVFELLSRFGNGAKSFRELPPDAFVPIREAIDNGALT